MHPAQTHPNPRHRCAVATFAALAFAPYSGYLARSSFAAYARLVRRLKPTNPQDATAFCGFRHVFFHRKTHMTGLTHQETQWFARLNESLTFIAFANMSVDKISGPDSQAVRREIATKTAFSVDELGVVRSKWKKPHGQPARLIFTFPSEGDHNACTPDQACFKLTPSAC
jgi:hypothetical protein